MERPENLYHCPFCNYNGLLNVKKRKLKKVVKSKIYHNWFWSYECPECSERFTTEKSDNLSLK